MMSGEAWLFLLSVLINAVNLFLQVFFTIMYSDLEWYVATLPFRLGAKICARGMDAHSPRRQLDAGSTLWTHELTLFSTVITSTPLISATDSTPTSSPRPPFTVS